MKALDPVEELLARLEGVRKVGRGWIAKCPAHDDRSPSLSIAHGDGGRLLIHDFGGCPVTSILQAIGLSSTDLFPERDYKNLPPAERARIREFAGMGQWRAALGVLHREATIVAIAAGDIATGIALNRSDHGRLLRALELIDQARAVLT